MTSSSRNTFSRELAQHYATIALGHIGREYPHKADHVMDSADDVYRPRDMHPVFYGSFDWHSCVHGYWLLVRIRRLFPDLPAVSAIEQVFSENLTPPNVARERAYLERPSSRGFERPYGWAWLLKLFAELASDPSDLGQHWSKILSPLATAFADRLKAFLPLQTYPVRNGSHANTAFALRLCVDYARTVEDQALLDLLQRRAWAYYGADRAAQAWEPSGDDFLSPTLSTAQALKRLLPQDAFAAWFSTYLPELSDHWPPSLFEPATVSDRSDGKIAHLDGLNLSRAWAWRELGADLPSDARAICEETAQRHLNLALPHVAGDYMGEHWLATFAVLALTEGQVSAA